MIIYIEDKNYFAPLKLGYFEVPIINGFASGRVKTDSRNNPDLSFEDGVLVYHDEQVTEMTTNGYTYEYGNDFKITTIEEYEHLDLEDLYNAGTTNNPITLSEGEDVHLLVLPLQLSGCGSYNKTRDAVEFLLRRVFDYIIMPIHNSQY